MVTLNFHIVIYMWRKSRTQFLDIQPLDDYYRLLIWRDPSLNFDLGGPLLHKAGTHGEIISMNK